VYSCLDHPLSCALTPMIRISFLCLVASLVVAADADPSTSTAMLADITAANEARAAVGREAQAWNLERERMEALLAAITDERDRLLTDATSLSAATKKLAEEQAQLGDEGELENIRTQLNTAAAFVHAELQRLAKLVPPGTIQVPDLSGDHAFDEAMRALDVSERAAAMVAVEIVTGLCDGKELAVKMLRVSGAAAWWESLDATRAGTATISNGTLHLVEGDTALREAIHRAVLIVEGRAPAEAIELPLSPILVGSAQP
jgi:hypothetical protein